MYRFSFWGAGFDNLLSILVTRKQAKQMVAELKYDKVELFEESYDNTPRTYGRQVVSFVKGNTIIARLRATTADVDWLYPMMN